MLTALAEDAGILDGEDAAEIVEDEVPEPPVDPITKPGDLWILGDHRLLCGDSTKAEDVERLMGGAKADLCFTSPPYGQQRDYTKEGKAKVADWDGLMRGVFGNLPMADAGQVLVNLGMIHRDGEWLPYWDSWIEWMREQGWKRFGLYVWDQGDGLPGHWQGRFAPSHELIFHFTKAPQQPEKFIPCKTAGKINSSGSALKSSGKSGKSAVWETADTKIPDSVIRIARARSVGVDHPAIFPVEFAAFGIQCWSGTVYEPFCGSGTTLIAAEQLGRKCYGMEISPQYCDVIVKRWETLTGRQAERRGGDDQAGR
jgi:DNA modification methylase